MKLSDTRIISSNETSAWMKAIQLCGMHDIYHLPQYHCLAEELGEGKAYLFFYQENGRYAALPFLVRPIAEIGGLESSRCNDISSVYGYPGLLTSLSEKDQCAEEFRCRFQSELLRVLKQLSAVSFFTRTNPLFDFPWLLKGQFEIILLGSTVAIDLSKGDKEQLGQMTKGHKYDIRKAYNEGVIVEEDTNFVDLDDFINIYNETMMRNNADEKYYFKKSYYLNLKDRFGDYVKLYFAKVNNKTISASIFFFYNNIIQYHLSGTKTEFLSLNGAKIIIEEVRKLGTKNRYSWLHLGGGLGSSHDNLFRFKAGFSRVRLPFNIVKIIVEQEEYKILCDMRMKWIHEKPSFPQSSYFPDYRKPIT